MKQKGATSMAHGILKSRRWVSHFVLGLVCLAAGFSSPCTGKCSSAPGPPPPSVPGSVAEARDVPVFLDEIGKNGAFESVPVTPQLGGRITERHFEDGADLHKGQLLFVIDPRPYQG